MKKAVQLQKTPAKTHVPLVFNLSLWFAPAQVLWTSAGSWASTWQHQQQHSTNEQRKRAKHSNKFIVSSFCMKFQSVQSLLLRWICPILVNKASESRITSSESAKVSLQQNGAEVGQMRIVFLSWPSRREIIIRVDFQWRWGQSPTCGLWIDGARRKRRKQANRIISCIRNLDNTRLKSMSPKRAIKGSFDATISVSAAFISEAATLVPSRSKSADLVSESSSAVTFVSTVEQYRGHSGLSWPHIIVFVVGYASCAPGEHMQILFRCGRSSQKVKQQKKKTVSIWNEVVSI